MVPWSRTVQRHPALAALASGALLLALCIPTLSLRLGSNDAGTDPAGTTTREAYDLLAEGFGPGFNGPLSIVAALPSKGDDAALLELRRTLDAEPGVAETTPVMLNPAETTGVFQAYPTTSPESADTTDLLRRRSRAATSIPSCRIRASPFTLRCSISAMSVFSISFSFAIAALIDGRIDAAWARWVRPWTLLAWMFLTLGIAMGSYWAYYTLGWGGWWFWDPVENDRSCLGSPPPRFSTPRW